MWELETNLRSSARAAGALTPGHLYSPLPHSLNSVSQDPLHTWDEGRTPWALWAEPHIWTGWTLQGAAVSDLQGLFTASLWINDSYSVCLLKAMEVCPSGMVINNNTEKARWPGSCSEGEIPRRKLTQLKIRTVKTLIDSLSYLQNKTSPDLAVHVPRKKRD